MCDTGILGYWEHQGSEGGVTSEGEQEGQEGEQGEDQGDKGMAGGTAPPAAVI